MLTLQFSRSDESDADLVGLELPRGGCDPQAAVSLWQKMGNATGSKQGGWLLSTHPSGPARIKELQANVPKVQGAVQAARKARLAVYRVANEVLSIKKLPALTK